MTYYNTIMIQRSLTPYVLQALEEGLVAIIYGARQVGKTTLVKHILSTTPSHLYLNCDDPLVAANLTSKSAIELKSYIGDVSIVAFDEAQRIENIGLTLKLIHDTYPDVKLLVTGSSSLDLANKVKEPLTGRSAELQLYPLSIAEVSQNSTEIPGLINIMLIRGGYPGMWSLPAERAFSKLDSLANNYIFRDAFSPNTLFDQTTINDLLRLLAHQIGQEVSYGELGFKLGISKDTVARYIDLLEKAFIVFRRYQYRRNERAEVGRLRKVYFVDLGVRNAMIDNFKPLEFRDDQGALWENFCVLERLKFIQSKQRRVRSFYWRGADKQEVDIVEEESGDIRALECKFGDKKNAKIPSSYRTKYPTSSFNMVSPQTFAAQILK